MAAINGTAENIVLKQELKDLILDLAHPVGSYYQSDDSTEPSTLFGGTWEAIYGRFLLASGSNAANTTNAFGTLAAGVLNTVAGEKGGEVKHKNTIEETASHVHEISDNDIVYSDFGNTGQYSPVEGPMMSLSQNVNPKRTTKSTGGNQPHNNMPPYLTVYMWKRIA